MIVQGYEETWTSDFEWDIVWNCTPGAPWTVAVRDDTTLARRDTAGSQLAAGVSSGATSLSVATTLGPLWTTDPADMPLLIEVGGEVMRVSAIAGASSPQTFTISARSVNGIVKAQTVNTTVALAQSATRAL
ncbi:hypothetical protein ACWGQ5_34335 [Streptomyces sp. NPDC055722]